MVVLLGLCLWANVVSAADASNPPSIRGYLITPLSGEPIVRTRNGNTWVFNPEERRFELQLQDKLGRPLHRSWSLTLVTPWIDDKIPLGDDTLWLLGLSGDSHTPKCVSLSHDKVIPVPLGHDIESMTIVEAGEGAGLGVAALSQGGLRLFKLKGCTATPIHWDTLVSAQWELDQLFFAPEPHGVTLFVQSPTRPELSPEEAIREGLSQWMHVVHVSLDDNTVRAVNVAPKCGVTYWGMTGSIEKKSPYSHEPGANKGDAVIKGWWRGDGALCYLETPRDVGFIELPDELRAAEAILHPIDRRQAWLLVATTLDKHSLIYVDGAKRAWADMKKTDLHVMLDHRVGRERILFDHGTHYWRTANIAFDRQVLWYFDAGGSSNANRTFWGWALARIEYKEGELHKTRVVDDGRLRSFFKNDRPGSIYMYSPTKDGVWLAPDFGQDKRWVMVDSHGQSLVDLSSQLGLDGFFCFHDGICWARSGRADGKTVQFQRIDASSRAFSLKLSFGWDTFDLGNGPWVLTSSGDERGRLHGESDWKWSDTVRLPTSDSGSQVDFWLQQEKGEDVVRGSPSPVVVKSPAGFLLEGSSALDMNAPFALHARYHDTLGSNIEVEWKNVRYQVPWYKNAIIVSAFLALLAVAIGLIISVFSESFLGRWLPPLFWFLPFTGATVQMVKQKTELQVGGLSLPIHSGFLVGWTIVFVGLAMTAGFISPKLFRHLARVEGVKWAAAAALRSPFARRHLFHEYVQNVSSRLHEERMRAAEERYYNLPAELELGKTSMAVTAGSSTEKRLLNTPAEEILRIIQERSNPAPILWIEGPGGRGKSALLREIVGRLLQEFEATGACPLPVILPAGKRLVLKDIEDMLGRFAPTPELLANQLREGDFLIVIDGLSEMEPDPKTLQDFLETEEGAACPLLVTAQPREDLRRALSGSPRFMRILPKPLNADTVSAFIDTYERGATLSPEQLDACGTREGYMPLLVRWMVRYRTQALTRADLYSAFCEELLSRIPAEATRREELYTLCLQEYWEKGQTQFRCDDTNRAACEARVRAGLMVAVKRNLANHSLIDVKFFHDSVMSYLTAEALRHDEELRWSSLPKAAGHAHFRKRQQGSRTELFQMMIDTYGLSELAPKLEQWLVEQTRTLDARKQDIVDALPEHLKAVVRTEDQWASGSGPLLRSAIAHCKEDPEALATLFSGIARLVFVDTVSGQWSQ
jgi:hypothetical protein